MKKRIGSATTLSTHHMSDWLSYINRPIKMMNTRGVTKESDTHYRKKTTKGAAHAAKLTSSVPATMKATIIASTDTQ
jgi:hypothetical protein